MGEIDRLLDGAPRFRNARVTVEHWADRAAYRHVLERFRSNPTIARWLEAPAMGSPGIQTSVWRVWLERPFRFRVEEPREPGGPSDVAGGDAHGHWQFISSEGRVYRSTDGITASVSRIGRETTLDDLAELDIWSPLFHVHLHPMVAELLDPGRLLSPDGTDIALDVLGPTTFLGRSATRLRGGGLDWTNRDPIASENLWVADDYDIIFDDATGVILRFACRADGEEFSVREMSEVTFDKPIDPTLFEPPSGIPQQPYVALPHRILRKLRRRPRRRRRQG